MKKKLWILISSLILMLATLILGFFTRNVIQIRILIGVELIFLTYVLLYFFGGIGKLTSSLIYGMAIAIFLVLFPQYDMAFIFIGTFLFALNPLGELEKKIDERFPNEKPILSYFKGSYAPYYEYRKEVKNYYHLPQMRKIYTRPMYLRLRQAVTILMSMAAVFLLIREVNNLINILKNFDIHIFFASTYSVIVLVILTIILYKKGFQSMVNFLTVSIFPPVAYWAFLKITPNYLAIIIGILIILLAIAVGIYQYFAFRSRIVYEYYYYYDNNRQAEVFANALFEPFVYSDDFNLAASFKIKTNITKFNKEFHNIVVFADFNRFFITAYTNNHQEIVIYTDFHKSDSKKIEKFKIYLETIFEESVVTNIIVDHDKKFYEKNFFHNHDYIVARTIYLADLLKKLEIKSNIIISMVAYFKNSQDINNMGKSYSITRLPEFDLDDIMTVRIDIKVNNVDYIIEAKLRELLLDLLINSGTYVRVSVYY